MKTSLLLRLLTGAAPKTFLLCAAVVCAVAARHTLAGPCGAAGPASSGCATDLWSCAPGLQNGTTQRVGAIGLGHLLVLGLVPAGLLLLFRGSRPQMTTRAYLHSQMDSYWR